MPRQPEQLLASPPLIFDPPPRRTYDYLSDGDAYCLEPRRSTDTDRVLKHRNSTPKAEGREPGRGVKPRPMVARPAARRSRRKHSKQDLETQRNTEDASATYWQDDRQNEAEGPGLAESHAHIVVDSDVSEDTEERPSSEYELELNEEDADKAGLSALLQDVKEQGRSKTRAEPRSLAFQGRQPLRSVKLCFVGHARAGKTSTLRALADRRREPSRRAREGWSQGGIAKKVVESFDPEQPSTHGPVLKRLKDRV
ncbi:unnamed protein product [Effrenium voratum]|nr:unnamed protein product [Effrenium voratum]